ncbi:MAG: hypothetical protein FWC82_03185 [Firmicutes bacterium]|nr:hypothetical protein [Bacillota bacterium]
MTNEKRFEAVLIATRLRQMLTKDPAHLSQDSYREDLDTLQDEDNLRIMIESVGGKLIQDEPEYDENGNIIKPARNYVVRTENGFIIYFKQEDGEHFPYLSILHELGHAFMHMRDKEAGYTMYCDGKDSTHDEAWVFARTLAMPRKFFEEIAIENFKDDKYHLKGIIETYKEDYFQIQTRGLELNIWK